MKALSSGYKSIPVLLLGGEENSLSVVRSLTRHGVSVSLSAVQGCWALRSRHCAQRYIIPKGCDYKAFWGELLVGTLHPELHGTILFPCSDEAIEFIATNFHELNQKYRLDGHNADQQLAMLDKHKTLELAQLTGMPIPQYLKIEKPEDIEAIHTILDFPVIIKPIHSHIFQRTYHRKLLLIENYYDLRRKVREIINAGLEIMVCEFIPGPDDMLSSYYTYIDADGNHLFDFTKRILRRSPVNFGRGTYHITEWNPETAALGKKYFKGTGFRGLGNIEFKWDKRDGQLKVIEVNARFTAAQELLVRSGMDIAWIIYNHIIGKDVSQADGFREGMRLWNFADDFDAFRELHARGELSFVDWLRSIAHHQVLPYFSASDPMPAFSKGWHSFRRRVLRR